VPIPFSKKICHLLGEYFFQKESKFITENFVFRKLCHLLAILHPKRKRLISTERSPLSHLLIKARLLFFSLNQVLFEQNPANLAN